MADRIEERPKPPAPRPGAWKAGFLNEKRKARPEGDAPRKKPKPIEGDDGPARAPRKKLIVPGPDGWDTELKPMFHPPMPKMGPYLMKLPSQLEHVVKHEWCSLDEYKHWKLHCEVDVGVKIDLIKGDTPPGDPTNVLPPEDEELLKSLEPLMAGATYGKETKAPSKGKDAVWLKNTVYLSNNLHAPVHAFGSRSKEQIAERAKIDGAKIEALDGNDVNSSFVKAAAVDAATLKHPTKPNLTAEYVLPIAPDVDLWANSYVQVSIADDPDGSARRAGRAPAVDALVSKVCTTSHRRRGANVLSASLSLPATDGDASYQWTRQYQLNFKEERAQDGERLVLLADPANGRCTYLRQQPKRMELDKGRPFETAREDAETPVDLDWSGATVVAYERDPAHRARGLDATARNEWRAKMRQLGAVECSEDEEVSDDESSGEEEDEDE
mmetsp:Transcript_3033/g.8870  ORF Transcript_3033/g.8870 Transcript_3033/m.8870 type:complete len:441 (-) Transcript_3033:36-1358(-)